MMRKYLLTSAMTLILAFAMTSVTRASFIVIIQPSADLNDIVWTVEWDSLYSLPPDDFDLYDWDTMDPATGDLLIEDAWGAFVNEVYFANVGNPFGPVYTSGDIRGFGDGIGGVISSPSGYGVGPDNDNDSTGDDLFLFNWMASSTNPVPNDGSFVLTVPGANLGNYNLGTYTNNPNVTITVTDTPLKSVPEPSTFVLLGIGGFALVGYGWRRKRHLLRSRPMST